MWASALSAVECFTKKKRHCKTKTCELPSLPGPSHPKNLPWGCCGSTEAGAQRGGDLGSGRPDTLKGRKGPLAQKLQAATQAGPRVPCVLLPDSSLVFLQVFPGGTPCPRFTSRYFSRWRFPTLSRTTPTGSPSLGVGPGNLHFNKIPPGHLCAR